MSEYISKEEKIDCLKSAQVCLEGATNALARAGFGSLAYLGLGSMKTTVNEIIDLLEEEE